MPKPSHYWSFEKCKEVALTCNSRNEFKHKYRTAYQKCLDKKWIELVSMHMKPPQEKINGHLIK
jgi:hypothetical protein